jgi:hypothetical protein
VVGHPDRHAAPGIVDVTSDRPVPDHGFYARARRPVFPSEKLIFPWPGASLAAAAS